LVGLKIEVLSVSITAQSDENSRASFREQNEFDEQNAAAPLLSSIESVPGGFNKPSKVRNSY